jgi:hypothetical protein
MMNPTSSPVPVPQQIDAVTREIVSPLATDESGEVQNPTIAQTCHLSQVTAHFPLLTLFACISFGEGDEGNLLDVLSPSLSWRTLLMGTADTMGQDSKKKQHAPSLLLFSCSYHHSDSSHHTNSDSRHTKILSACTSQTSKTLLAGPVAQESIEKLAKFLAVHQDGTNEELNPSQIFKKIIEVLHSRVELASQDNIQDKFKNLASFLEKCWVDFLCQKHKAEIKKGKGKTLTVSLYQKQGHPPNLDKVSRSYSL